MENIFKYYDFSSFFEDESNAFSNNLISYSELNATHFLIFEKVADNYNLYVSRYTSKKSIGKEEPEILEKILDNYDKSIPAHRIALKKYFQ